VYESYEWDTERVSNGDSLRSRPLLTNDDIGRELTCRFDVEYTSVCMNFRASMLPVLD
jgi:hypothetical protein